MKQDYRNTELQYFNVFLITIIDHLWNIID